MILVHFFKQIGYTKRNSTESIGETLDLNGNLEEKFVFDNWTHFVTWAAFGSYFIYFAVGGFLHVSEYVKITVHVLHTHGRFEFCESLHSRRDSYSPNAKDVFVIQLFCTKSSKLHLCNQLSSYTSLYALPI